MSNEKENKTENQEETLQILPALNTIYYGPPGTGKTYTLNQLKEKFNTIEEKSIKEVKQEDYEYSILTLLSSSKECIAYILSKENKLSSTNLSRSLLFIKWYFDIKKHKQKDPRSTITTALTKHATQQSTIWSERHLDSHTESNLFEVKDKLWSLTPKGSNYIEKIINDIKSNMLLEDEAPNQNNDDKASVTKEKNYQFVTFHQKYGYEDFIEGIKPLLSEEDDEDSSSPLSFVLSRGIFYNACRKALSLAGYYSFDECFKDEQRAEKFKTAEPYALFIDEINRANVSAVFGELITLIEDTKRIGASEETRVTLPVSGDEFCVPPNLYIIGTMNTADRSLSLLDIALRRRFSFEYVGPNYTLIGDWSDLLKALNKIIYDKKKNADFFIGHSFFLNVSGKPHNKSELAHIFNTKIIPLLMEYFQNNVNVVVEILEELSKVDSSIQFDKPSIENNFSLKLKA